MGFLFGFWFVVDCACGLFVWGLDPVCLIVILFVVVGCLRFV